MNDEIEEAHYQLRRQLEHSETALLHGNRAVLFRHGRWHYLTLGDQIGGMGVQALNFLSPGRAESLITAWLTGGAQPVAFTHVSPIWSAEVAEKVLPTAAAYRLLLLAGRVSLVRGSTTDTLWVMGGAPGSALADETAVLSFLAQMMASGQAGPYLRFR
ncbi:MAG: hypothetical protein IPJ94_24665 [Chloroflexi bacterium]|nr:hypothetical protein [Chloroflexota bacterium]